MKQKNRPFSTLILNLRIARQLAWKSFGIWPRFPVIFPFNPSQDPALNRKTRRLSIPNRKSSLENRVGGYSTEHLATQEWFPGRAVKVGNSRLGQETFDGKKNLD